MGLDRNWKRILTFVTVLLLAFTFENSSAFAASGSELKSKLSTIQQDKKKNENAVQKAQKALEQNKSKQQDALSKINQVSDEINKTQQQIAEKQNEVTDTKTKINQLKNNIEDLQSKIKRRNELLKERVRAIYQDGGPIDYIQVLLGSKNFGDFLDRVMALNMVAVQDKHIILAQEADKANLQVKQKEVEKELKQVESDLSDLQQLNAELSNQKKQKEKLLADLQSQASELEQEKMSKQEQAKNLSAQETTVKKALAAWKREQARIAKEKAAAEKTAAEKAAAEKAAAKKAAGAKTNSSLKSRSSHTSQSSNQSESSTQTSSSSSSATSSELIWPAQGYISSPFGWRTWPDGSKEFHSGIDIAAPEGTPIYAAADGFVFRSYLSSSYGNCIMITHVINGKIYTTVYAHMRERLVSDGQAVKQGQLIGHIGITGESTGPHLHFELYDGEWQPSNGTIHPGAINPLTMLP